MLSPEEVEQFRKKYNITPSTPESKSSSGYLSRVGSSIKKEAQGAVNSVQRGAELMQQGKPIQGAIRSGLGSAGATVRAGFSPVTEAVAPILAPVVQKIGSFIGEDNIQKVQEWATKHPDAAANLQDVFDIGTAIYGTKGAKLGATKAKQAATTVASTIPKPPPGTGKAIVSKAGSIMDKGAGLIDTVAQEAKQIPSRVATNVAEKQAKQATIRSLPGKIAQKAAQDGIDPNDVKFLYKLPKEVKASAKELAETTRKFSAGAGKKNPIEVVGKPIIERLKQLESERGTVGQKLGEVANRLGNVTPDEATPAVIAELKKVRGLNGINVDERGILDFSNTSLASGLSKSDQSAIQEIFTEATKAGTGKQKHLLRQELFEIIGGKKRALQNITDTQDKAFQAVRTGLSNILEGKDNKYKALNKRFAKVAQPLQDMRKLMKGVAGADEDILDMSAGLLARRLTSNAASNPQIRAILKSMDKATTTAGKSQVSVEVLQDFYNILNKYYDIAGKTGFQGQVKAGIESAGGLGDVALQALKGVAGETPAVRQKALEAVLKEILN